MSDEEEPIEVVVSEQSEDDEPVDAENEVASETAVVACNENVQKLMNML